MKSIGKMSNHYSQKLCNSPRPLRANLDFREEMIEETLWGHFYGTMMPSTYTRMKMPTLFHLNVNKEAMPNEAVGKMHG